MKLEGTYTFDAPRDDVWSALMDPEVLARVMPGCDKLEQIGEDSYSAALKIKVGPVQGKFKGSVHLSDIKEPDSYVMQVDGKGPSGFMKGTGSIRLEAQGEASTLMHYAGDAQVGGRIASVGQRLLDSSAKALTKQSLDNLHAQIKVRIQPVAPPPTESNGAAPARAAAVPAPPPPAAQSPSEFEFALGVAKNMAEDLIPPERRPTLIAAGLGVLAVILLFNWWASVIARKVVNELERG